LVNFSNKLDKLDTNLVQPYSLIRFQIPTIIKAQNPRLPTVSLCATYTYGSLPPEIFTWIDFNLAIGIKKILIYDGNSIENKFLVYFFNSIFFFLKKEPIAKTLLE
jgi:hypothetical protein